MNMKIFFLVVALLCIVQVIGVIHGLDGKVVERMGKFMVKL
jgi:hypothetical protein